MKEHPVLVALRHFVTAAPIASDTSRERAVIAKGRPFVGIDRPREFRPRKEGANFANAQALACEGRGSYVEGFALNGPGYPPIHHAWVTVDGIHAVDVSWRQTDQVYYFGIVFPMETVRASINGHRSFRPVLEWRAMQR